MVEVCKLIPQGQLKLIQIAVIISVGLFEFNQTFIKFGETGHDLNLTKK